MVWLYSLVSVVIVSGISLISVLLVSVTEATLNKFLRYLVSFSAGGLFGDAFIHLIPEAMGSALEAHHASLLVIVGIGVSFTVERVLQWRHCHIPTTTNHPHSFAYMNLLGDAMHNFIDGLVVGASYVTSPALGVATTLAVVFHEIPQELGDFGVLIYGGFSRSKALLFNFLTALTAIGGAVTALTLGNMAHSVIPFLIPFAAGNFIYVAGSDLIPELSRDEPQTIRAVFELLAFGLGVLALYSLVSLE